MLRGILHDSWGPIDREDSVRLWLHSLGSRSPWHIDPHCSEYGGQGHRKRQELPATQADAEKYEIELKARMTDTQGP